MKNELSEERLLRLESYALAESTTYCNILPTELLELVRAYRYHKSVLPLHQAINEACKKLGY